jgi:DNA-binding NtrC family response regulator
VSTVLLVQPDAALHEQWTEALARNGHDVLSVRSVVDGIARAREGGIDVIVLDAPGNTDASTHELVNELERLPDAPPLVLISESPKAPELSAQIGAAGFLPKPCSHEDLVDLVARVASARVPMHRFDDENTSPKNRF